MLYDNVSVNGRMSRRNLKKIGKLLRTTNEKFVELLAKEKHS